MGKVEKISVALTDELLSSVHDAVATGDYASSSEVVREALREWKQRRLRERDAIGEIRRMVAEADASGYTPFNGFEEATARARDRLEAARTAR